MFLICWKIPVIGMKTNNIRVLATSLVGPMHTAQNLPCQDYCKYSLEGKNFVAVVSDGAGSSKYGKIGAKIICNTLTDLLPNADFNNAKEAVIKAIMIARNKLLRHRLNKTKNEAGLVDVAATLVGVIYCRHKGLFFHIGDGAALAFHQDNFEHFTASRPENGHFSCETYFYTMDDWKDSLRFTSFDKAHTLFLMSDGLTNFSFSKDYSHIEKNFIVPIDTFLSNATNKRKAQKALENTLNNAKARKLNSDDKTLLWVKL